MFDEHDAVALREFLADRDVACPACAYSLRGLTGVRCPECNQAIMLRVGLVDPLGLGYIMTLIGLAAGSGAAFLIVVGVVAISLIEKDFPRGTDAVVLMHVPALIAALLGVPLGLLAARRGRLWFGRMTKRWRRSLAWAAWMATFLFVAVWIGLVVRLV